MNGNKHQSGSWPAALIAALYFFLAGLNLVSSNIPPDWSVAGLQRGTDTLIWDTGFWFGLLVPAIAFAVGWVLGFPRWSYPFTGGLLVFSLYMMSTSTPLLRQLGYLNQGWGWRAWLPFLLALLVGLLITRSLRPIGQFFANIHRDWTQATFAMYGCMPLVISIFFDEIDRLYTTIFMLLLIALMVAIALLYMRAVTQTGRIRILTAGVLATLAVTLTASTAYWLPRGGVSVPGVLIWGLVILGIMFYPALLRSRATSNGSRSDPA